MIVFPIVSKRKMSPHRSIVESTIEDLLLNIVGQVLLKTLEIFSQSGDYCIDSGIDSLILHLIL